MKVLRCQKKKKGNHVGRETDRSLGFMDVGIVE